MTNVTFAYFLLAGCFLSRALAVCQPAGIVIGWGSDYAGAVTGNTNLSAGNYATGVVMIAGQPLTNAVWIAAGGSHSLALTADGVLVGWGANGGGEAVGRKVPEPYYGSGPVEIGGQPLRGIAGIAASRSVATSFSIALMSNGTVVVWGDGRQDQTAVPAGLSSVVAVSAGSEQGLALKADGTVVSWGWGNPPPPGLSNVVAISASADAGRNLALTRDGRVVDWWARQAARYDSTVPMGLSNVVAVSAGWNHSLALRRDGTVLGWGFDNVGQATGISNTTPARQATGTVMVARHVLSNAVAIAAAHDYSLALRRDGTIAAWGYAFGVSVPEGLSNVVAISAADYFCLAITTNRAVAERFMQKR